ncbi:unnamed protein product [Lactuca saligna]|uniref:Uncharacterized protein n=1 Tax=Lactuca saligna TaxID=75948 RepID=A0AA35Z7P8_LACSI|nr:unnamed protein product [Lactuca saligna]
MVVESEEVHHESSEEYEDDEEGKERCKDAFLNFSSDYEDNEVDEDNDLVDEDEEGFGSEEEIDDTTGANDLDLGDAVGAGFPIHDPSVKWNKMKPLLGERFKSIHRGNRDINIHRGNRAINRYFTFINRVIERNNYTLISNTS